MIEPGDLVRTSWRDDLLPWKARAKEGRVVRRHEFYSTLTGTEILVVRIAGEDYGVRADRLRPA